MLLYFLLLPEYIFRINKPFCKMSTVKTTESFAFYVYCTVGLLFAVCCLISMSIYCFQVVSLFPVTSASSYERYRNIFRPSSQLNLMHSHVIYVQGHFSRGIRVEISGVFLDCLMYICAILSTWIVFKILVTHRNKKCMVKRTEKKIFGWLDKL